MKFIHRLGYYLGGLAVGLLFLAFFLTGKRASCDYSPDARVLKNIRIKPMTYSEEIEELMEEQHIDSVAINRILNYGDVIFKKSNTTLDSCRTYYIQGEDDERNIHLTIANCETVTRLLKLEVKKKRP